VIGVVLSGAGSDGALDIEAIKLGGGSTFAQYWGSARFPSMPINAIETGCMGFVLRPNEIARKVTRLTRRAARPADGARSGFVAADKAGPRQEDVVGRRLCEADVALAHPMSTVAYRRTRAIHGY
jgi:CheB methylesterase